MWWARLAWAGLCSFIAVGSLGTWSEGAAAIWAPTLIVVRDVERNVAMYVVFGVLGVLSLRRTYPRHWFRLVLRVTALALLFSFANEMLQLYTIDRVASVTDIASAGIGSFAGALVMAAFGRLRK